MIEISRYDTKRNVSTPLDPLDDLISWIAGLRSQGYVSDILSTVHKIPNAEEITSSAKLISILAEASVGLIQGGLAGPAEVSFLPLYYSILNLSKIYIILAGHQSELIKQRQHGASYPQSDAHDILDDLIKVHDSGTFPLFYYVLTDEKLENQQIQIGSLYPYVGPVTHEFEFATHKPSALQVFTQQFTGDAQGGFRLSCQLLPGDNPNGSDLTFLRAFDGFSLDENNKQTLVSEIIKAETVEQAAELIKKKIRRYLIYSPPSPRVFGGLVQATLFRTPISNLSMLLPEEIPIWLVFFHLSNVVRYRPEFLFELRDSKFWALILSLKKHALYRFLLLFWSYLHQTTFTLSGE